jgi:hypothetical protein
LWFWSNISWSFLRLELGMGVTKVHFRRGGHAVNGTVVSTSGLGDSIERVAGQR